MTPNDRHPKRNSGSSDTDVPDDLIFGRHPVYEALQANKRSLHKLWVLHGATGGVIDGLLALARERGVPIERADKTRLDRMTLQGNHQGVAAQITAASYLEIEDFLKALADDQKVVVVALDEIQDPQNVGAIMRSAGFFGVSAILMPRWRSAPVGETAWRVAAGAAEHLTFVRVRNLVDAMEQLKDARFQVIGADAEGESISAYVPGKRTALVLGNEGTGMRRLVRERCDQLVGIPTRTPVSSLNVGAATAILLHELFRPR